MKKYKAKKCKSCDYAKRKHQGKLFSVICARCKHKCNVPFKPVNSVPVFCKKCFKIIKGK